MEQMLWDPPEFHRLSFLNWNLRRKFAAVPPVFRGYAGEKKHDNLTWRRLTATPLASPWIVESKNVTQLLMFRFNCVCNSYVIYKHKSIQLNTTLLKGLTELPLCFSSTICTIPMQTTMFKIQSHFTTRWLRRLWCYHMECVDHPQWRIMGKGLKCLLSVREWYAYWHSGTKTTHSSLTLKRRIFSVWAADPPLRSMCCSHTL